MTFVYFLTKHIIKINVIIKNNKLLMKYKILILTGAIIFAASCNSQNSDNNTENNDSSSVETVIIKKIEPQEKAKYPNVKSIPVPEGFTRITTTPGSFGDYLRNTELKTEDNKVYLHNGELKWNQSAQFAVLKIDVGTRDLQQCADAVMRLRAEYLYEQKQYNKIHFNFLSDGKPRYFNDYAKGDLSHKKFRKYMDYIFSYANTSSLKNELKKVNSSDDIQIGDVFIQKGKPYGHAITVMDIAKNESGEIIFLLSQSYMPAQDIHILKNPKNKAISPWYKAKKTGSLYTPEWTFTFNDLMRF